MLFSSTAVLIHSFVLTEPSFIVFALSSFIMLALYFKLNKFYLFFISALLASLSILDRYVGVSVIATGIMCILLWEKGIIIARIKKSFLFGVVSMFPISLWLIHNYLIAGTFTDRIFSFHLITLDNIFLFFITLSEWVVPYWHNIFIGILFLVFIITVLVVCIKQRTKLFKEATTTEVFYLRIIDILIIFIIFYLFFIFFSTSFFDALTPFNYRILAPVYFSIIIVLASIVPRFIKNIYFTVAISLLCLISIAYGTYIITIINSQGLGFTKESITSSSVGAEILSIPKESTIYTNVPHMVYVLSKRLSYMFPQKQNPHAIILNDEYKNEFDKMIRGIEQGNSYILYITMSDFYDPRMQMPTLDEIKSAFSSDIVERVTEDATVFYRE